MPASSSSSSSSASNGTEPQVNEAAAQKLETQRRIIEVLKSIYDQKKRVRKELLQFLKTSCEMNFRAEYFDVFDKRKVSRKRKREEMTDEDGHIEVKKCPECGIEIKASRLPYHLAKQCQSSPYITKTTKLPECRTAPGTHQHIREDQGKRYRCYLCRWQNTQKLTTDETRLSSSQIPKTAWKCSICQVYLCNSKDRQCFIKFHKCKGDV